MIWYIIYNNTEIFFISYIIPFDAQIVPIFTVYGGNRIYRNNDCVHRNGNVLVYLKPELFKTIALVLEKKKLCVNLKIRKKTVFRPIDTVFFLLYE